jgi:2TM domain
MEQQSQTPPEKDPKLWAIAKKRAGFKKDLVTYFIINAFFWLIWLFTTNSGDRDTGVPWPVWPMAGWGIAILFQYFEAYSYPKENAAEKEYDKLKNKENK